MKKLRNLLYIPLTTALLAGCQSSQRSPLGSLEPVNRGDLYSRLLPSNLYDEMVRIEESKKTNSISLTSEEIADLEIREIIFYNEISTDPKVLRFSWPEAIKYGAGLAKRAFPNQKTLIEKGEKGVILLEKTKGDLEDKIEDDFGIRRGDVDIKGSSDGIGFYVSFSLGGDPKARYFLTPETLRLAKKALEERKTLAKTSEPEKTLVAKEE